MKLKTVPKHFEAVPFGGVYVPYFYSNAMYVRRMQELPYVIQVFVVVFMWQLLNTN